MTSEAERQRRARSSAALRENLKRRKAQVRARTPGAANPSGELVEPPHDAPKPARSPDNQDT